MSVSRSIMFVAGEISGDLHGAELIQSIKMHLPDFSFFGLGGPAMQKTGFESIYNIEEISVVGFNEVIKKIFTFYHLFKKLTKLAEKQKPAVAVLIDFPGMNLKLAKRLKALKIPVIYYICPQIWAWHRKRIKTIVENVDHLITIFPFEKQLFEGTGLRVDYTSHPLLQELEKFKKNFCYQPELWNGKPKIALMPGSRLHVVRSNLPIMLKTIKLLKNYYSELSTAIAMPTIPLKEEAIKICVDNKLPDVPVYLEKSRELLYTADAAIVTAGTVSLEAALLNCPAVIMYRTSTLTYLLGKLLCKAKFIGMVNILLDRQVCPELIQFKAKPENIASNIVKILRSSEEANKMRFSFMEAKKILENHPSIDAAKIISEKAIERIKAN